MQSTNTQNWKVIENMSWASTENGNQTWSAAMNKKEILGEKLRKRGGGVSLVNIIWQYWLRNYNNIWYEKEKYAEETNIF